MPIIWLAGVGQAYPTPGTQPQATEHTIFYDTFDGALGTPPDLTKWRYDEGDPGAFGNGELESYDKSPLNAYLDGQSHLAITAVRSRVPGGGFVYNSARLTTISYPFIYGHAEARIKVPAGQGLWPAFWMLGIGEGPLGWPACGEIDVMEALGRTPKNIYQSIHGPKGAATADSKSYYHTSTVKMGSPVASGWHVYAVDASPGVIKFSVDGHVDQVLKRADLSQGEDWVFDRPFRLILNLAVGGDFAGMPTSRTRFPATMLVDYVKVTATSQQEQQAAQAIANLERQG